jgi:hypothetical protein
MPPAPAPDAADPPPGLGKLGMLWVAGMVLYSGARALAVRELLAGYGVLPWLFFCLDAGTAVPLALGQVRIVQGLRGRNPAIVQKWSIIAGISFVTPYAYLMLGGNRPLPPAAYAIIGAFVAASVASTVWRIRAERRALEAVAHFASSTGLEGDLNAARQVEVEEERRQHEVGDR